MDSDIHLRPHDVEYEALRAAPNTYHGLRIRCRGVFSNAFEGQSFAGAWLNLPRNTRQFPQGPNLVEVVGVWQSDPKRGYGHMGLSSAELVAERIETVDEAPAADTALADLERDHESFRGRILSVVGDVRLAFMTCRLGSFEMRNGLRVAGVSTRYTAPIDVEARVTGFVLEERRSHGEVLQRRGFHAQRLEWLGQGRCAPIRTVTAEEAARLDRTGEVVDVRGTLVAGEYWPELDGVSVVIPELAATSHAYGQSASPPYEVRVWRSRLANPRGAIARGVVMLGNLMAFRIKLDDGEEFGLPPE